MIVIKNAPVSSQRTVRAISNGHEGTSRTVDAKAVDVDQRAQVKLIDRNRRTVSTLQQAG